jgi:hypothetical protein
MIIEIKDLPKDRNVKSVNFTIEFEDGDVKSVKPTTVVEKPVDVEVDSDIEFDKPESNMPEVTLHREHKEIPPEMTDMEF